MIGAMQVAGPGPPDHLPENQDEDKEKNSSHFQEEDVSHSAERFEKAPNTACQASGSPACGTACRTPGISSTHGVDGYGAGRCSTSRGLGRAREALPGHAASYANASSQYPADGLRFHTPFIMVAAVQSRGCERYLFQRSCSATAVDVRYIESQAAPCAPSALAAARRLP